MKKNEAIDKLQAIFRDLLDDESYILNEELTKDELDEWDSLFQITLLATVADEFEIEIPTSEIPHIASIEDILKFLSIEK